MISISQEPRLIHHGWGRRTFLPPNTTASDLIQQALLNLVWFGIQRNGPCDCPRKDTDCHPLAHLHPCPCACLCRSRSILGSWCKTGLIVSLPSVGSAIGNVCSLRSSSCLHCSLLIKHKCQQKLLSQPHEFCKKHNTRKKFYIVFPRCSL